MNKKIKVLWICHFSNEELRSRLSLKMSLIERIIRWLFHKPLAVYCSDYAQWITNAIREFENIPSVELHIIAPHPYLNQKKYEFEHKGVHYHIFRPSSSILWRRLVELKQPLDDKKFQYNRCIIGQYLRVINPDVINLIGHENSFFGNCIFDIDKEQYPIIISLQTLINDPHWASVRTKESIEELLLLEKEQFSCTPYFSTGVSYYKDIILSKVNRDAIVFKGSLCVGETIDISLSEKKYDFVFFASSVSKGLNEALESFVRTKKNHPSITMNIIGGITESQKQFVYYFLLDNNCKDCVTISGRLTTHDDVLNMIKKSRFALLPLKCDIVSGTIREAISRGLPVVTTITAGTPSLNIDRASVLLSEIGDYDAMANNMSKLLDNPELADTLRKNALITFEERYCNNLIANNMVDMYYAVYHHFNNKFPLPDELLL